YPLAFALCRHVSLPSLEVLHGTLVCLRCFPRTEGTQIAPFPSLGISFTRIQSILARFQLSNHWSLPPCLTGCDVRMCPAVVRHLHAKRCWLRRVLRHFRLPLQGISFDKNSLNHRLGIANTAFASVDGRLKFLHSEPSAKSNIYIEQHLIRAQ